MSPAHKEVASMTRIYRDFSRPDPTLIARIGAIPTADLCDCAGPVAVGGAIRPVVEGSFAGPALTVRVTPGDNLMVHAALELAQPGDVVVVDGGGCTDRALLGALTVSCLRRQGVAGIVVDGAVRDTEALRAMGVPIYAGAVCPNGPTRTEGGAVNTPVTIGGRAVRPGDIVAADADGVVILTPAQAEDAAEKARALADREDAALERIVTDGAFPRPWLAGALEALDCRYGDLWEEET